MSLSKVDKKALDQWQLKFAEIKRATIVTGTETKEQRAKRIERGLKDYNFFVRYYFPHYAKANCADFHIEAANKIKADPDIFAVLEWPREHAKSVHADVIIPMWLKANGALDGMILVGKSEKAACKLLGDLQAEFMANERYAADFGEQFKFGSWEEGDFTTADGINFIALGRGQSPRGIRNQEKRPNYCVVDDLDDDILCRNERRVEETVDWILEALYGALSIHGARFVMAGNRIHKKSVLAHIVGDIEPDDPKREDIWHSKVVAVVNGKPAWHQNYTMQQLNRKMNRMGYRRAQKEFFHNHIIEGKVFKNDWIRWDKCPKLHEFDKLVMYCDPSFKSTTENDYKAVRLWGKKGKYLYLVKCFVRQCSIGEMVRWVYDWYEWNVRKTTDKEAIVPFVMEANFVQDLLLDEFENEGELRGWMLPVRKDKRQKGDKYARIENTTPLYERGLVVFNIMEKKNKDMLAGLDQILGFQKGATIHDDAPDADEGAFYILQKEGRKKKTERRLGIRKPIGW